MGLGIESKVGLETVIEKLELVNRLGLTSDVDTALLTASFHARCLRNPGTHRTQILRHPYISTLRGWPIMGAVIRGLEGFEDEHRRDIQYTEHNLQEFIAKAYPSEQDRQRANAIVMAANALVAEGLARSGDTFHGTVPKMIFDMQAVASWGEFWKARIANP